LRRANLVTGDSLGGMDWKRFAETQNAFGNEQCFQNEKMQPKQTGNAFPKSSGIWNTKHSLVSHDCKSWFEMGDSSRKRPMQFKV
jgi:hypothetical protein